MVQESGCHCRRCDLLHVSAVERRSTAPRQEGRRAIGSAGEIVVSCFLFARQPSRELLPCGLRLGGWQQRREMYIEQVI